MVNGFPPPCRSHSGPGRYQEVWPVSIHARGHGGVHATRKYVAERLARAAGHGMTHLGELTRCKRRRIFGPIAGSRGRHGLFRLGAFVAARGSLRLGRARIKYLVVPSFGRKWSKLMRAGTFLSAALMHANAGDGLQFGLQSDVTVEAARRPPFQYRSKACNGAFSERAERHVGSRTKAICALRSSACWSAASTRSSTTSRSASPQTGHLDSCASSNKLPQCRHCVPAAA